MPSEEVLQAAVRVALNQELQVAVQQILEAQVREARSLRGRLSSATHEMQRGRQRVHEVLLMYEVGDRGEGRSGEQGFPPLVPRRRKPRKDVACWLLGATGAAAARSSWN